MKTVDITFNSVEGTHMSSGNIVRVISVRFPDCDAHVGFVAHYFLAPEIEVLTATFDNDGFISMIDEGLDEQEIQGLIDKGSVAEEFEDHFVFLMDNLLEEFRLGPPD